MTTVTVNSSMSSADTESDTIDGYFCQRGAEAGYSSKKGIGQWIQYDLSGFYSLKCVRIPVRTHDVYYYTRFNDLLFRFGNKSRNEEFNLNPIIGNTVKQQYAGEIVEFCPVVNLVGQYLLLQKTTSVDDFLSIGEVQIVIG